MPGVGGYDPEPHGSNVAPPEGCHGGGASVLTEHTGPEGGSAVSVRGVWCDRAIRKDSIRQINGNGHRNSGGGVLKKFAFGRHRRLYSTGNLNAVVSRPVVMAKIPAKFKSFPSP